MKSVMSRCLHTNEQDPDTTVIPGSNRLEEILFGHVILTNVQQVKTLLKYGVSPNCQDEQGNTPLHVLAGNEKPSDSEGGGAWMEVLRLLVYYGGQVDARNGVNLTPLMIASTSGHGHMVNQLVRAGCDVNLTNAEGNTALFSAVSRGHSRVVDVLLQSGRCDLKARPRSAPGLVRRPYGVVDLFRNVSHAAAAASGHQRAIDPMLIVASARGHNDIVRSLIRVGFDVDEPGRFQKTALHHASRCGHLEVARALLEAGAATDVQDNAGMTPLLLAATKGHLQRYKDVVELLVRAGADVRCIDIYGRNVFHVAAVQGCSELVKLLLSRGELAAAEALSLRGVSPLFNAIRANKMNTVKIMLAFNCRVDGTFFFQGQKRPLIWFPLHDGHGELAILLAGAGADLHQLLGPKPTSLQHRPLLHSAIRQNPTLLRALFEAAASPRLLIDLCRITIRKNLGYGIGSKVCLLPLPPGLQDCVLMKRELILDDRESH